MVGPLGRAAPWLVPFSRTAPAGPTLTPPMPQGGSTLPQAPLATAHGATNPAVSTSTYVPLSGKDLEALEALPQVVPKAGP